MYFKSLASQSMRVIVLAIICQLLTACQLNMDGQQKANIQVAQVMTELPERHNANYLSQLHFKALDDGELVAFDPTQNALLLRISLQDKNFSPSEAMLVVQPKYISSVTHFSVNHDNQLSDKQSLSRIDPGNRNAWSSQQFAFNIDQQNLNHIHYLVIESEVPRILSVALVPTDSFIKHDRQLSELFTFIYSVIFTLVMVNMIFYLYSHDRSYLLYSLYMASTLWALLWQEGKINDLPVLAISLMGAHSGLVYLAISDVFAVAFLYHFMKLEHRKSWLVKLLLVCMGFRVLLVCTAMIQFHFTDALNYPFISSLFNLSIVASSLLALTIIIQQVTKRTPQADYLLAAWVVLIGAVFLRIYFATHPHPDLTWMARSYEWAVMVEGLILALAIANRTMQFRIQRDRAVHKAEKATHAVHKHELLAQFHHDMQEVVKDATLSSKELVEKAHIKFHLLLNRAFPIKNSFIIEDNGITPICSTGFNQHDMELLKMKALQPEAKAGLVQLTVSTQHGGLKHMLFVPLRQHEHRGIVFILGLKKDDPLKPAMQKDILSFCDSAYAELLQAREMYQVALAANSDSMTHCHNRHSIECIIDQSLASKQLTTIAYVDLDNLKQINDQYGHDTGDQCIIEFARLLSDQVGPFARIGRIGGDEFVVVFTAHSLDRCEQLMNGFLQSLSEENISEHNIVLTSSIGMADSRMHETTRSLLKKADRALYHSKNAGRNQLTVFSVHHSAIQQQA